MSQEISTIPLNAIQIKNLLSYIDSSFDENIKEKIFCKLGDECYNLSGTDDWIKNFKNNHQKLIESINNDNLSPYWERLEFIENDSILVLTGKKVTKCACALGNSANPPKSLCNYCCKSYQKNIFSNFFNKNVEIEITESFILGGERCSTKIYIK
jgi:hypothetical protein